ncbi:tyrosine-type recombinase/integrase [Pseudoclavibacter sp. CFCC 13611]|uniref:tyrosine-type recombinase/integrase n=1 Tax=Pseudoclavibacter sp. CFCC 13611 TaxID=2615178 RepID=UPI0017882910|nr:tyrosine-type recombinase/integrase [Pseudoclavibacter sp. CFCC 13611]
MDTTTATTVANLVDRFTERKRQDADTAQATIRSYDSVAGVITGPDGCGELTLLEATPGRIVKWLRATATTRGAGIAKTARSVLSGALDIAIEDGALNQNPMRMLPKMKRPRPVGAQAIPPDEVPALRTAIATNKLVAERDLTDLLLLLLATGLRVGEACALRWDDIDLDAGTLTVAATAARVPGEGMIRQDRPKTDQSRRTITLPADAVKLLADRVVLSDLVFPASHDKPRDPSLVNKQLRACRAALGYPELTTHAFRKTVATALDAAGLSARAIADYLGHARPSMTEDVYLRRKLDTSAAAAALQVAMQSGGKARDHAKSSDAEGATPA